MSPSALWRIRLSLSLRSGHRYCFSNLGRFGGGVVQGDVFLVQVLRSQLEEVVIEQCGYIPRGFS